MIAEKLYEKKNWNEVIHTTWNPQGPGVIRIHMIPPKFSWFTFAPVVVILNGQEIIPLNESWAILLTEFIKNVNAHGPSEMSDEELQGILQKTYAGVKKVYKTVKEEFLREDLDTIVGIFEAIIHGEELPIEVGGLSIGQYAQNMTAPHRMDLMVSAMEKEGQWHCNQKCLHCYAAGQPLSNVKELSTAEWKEIIQKCRQAKIPQLTFTGGEPTLREDLCELIADAKWFVTRLNTNGIRLTKELCEELVQAQLDSVQVTFYSSEEDVHNQLVGATHFYDTVDGIKNALEAGLNLSVNTPLCTLNKDYVKTLEYLHGLGVEYVTCSGLIVTGNATSQESTLTQLSKAEMEEILETASKYCYEHGMEISFTSPGWVTYNFLHKLGMDAPSCGACLSNMAITPDGKVVPCQSWLSDRHLGSMLDSNWETIWNKKRCKEIRKESAFSKNECQLRVMEESKRKKSDAGVDADVKSEEVEAKNLQAEAKNLEVEVMRAGVDAKKEVEDAK